MTPPDRVSYVCFNCFVPLPIIDDETIREFSIRYLKTIGQYHGETTNLYLISQGGRSFGDVRIRHDKLADHVDLGKSLYVNPLPGGGSYARMLGNLREDSFMPEMDNCSICLEPFIFNADPKNKVIPLKNCEHRFHDICVYRLRKLECPLCSTIIDLEDIQSVAWTIEKQLPLFTAT